MLRGILRTGKVPTTFLFSGEKGVGKMRTALEFARALNCENLKDGDACDECSSCRKTGLGRHPDLKILEPDGGVIKVEQIRELEEFLSLTPYEGNKKIVIVDDADRMNTYAANAFLKTLEEPPDESIIMLISPREHLLPDTIRSRCLKLRFGPLSEDELKEVAGINGYESSDGVLGLAMGRPGSLSDEDLLGKRDEYYDMFRDMIKGKAVTPLKDKDAIEDLIDHCMIFLRDIAVLLSGRSAGLVNRDKEKELDRMGKGLDIVRVVRAYDQVQDLKRKMFYNLNKALLFNYLSSLLAVTGQPAK